MITRIFRNSRGKRLALLLAGALVVPAATLRAQTVEEQLQSMREEIQRLRQEVDGLKEELHQRAPGAATEAAPSKQEAAAPPATTQHAPAPARSAATSSSTGQELSPEEAIPLLQAQVAEHAQTKVESNSRMPVKIFGSLITQAFSNSHEVNWTDLPNIVTPTPQGVPRGSFGISLRQSRLGALVDGPTIGPFKASGMVAVDFLGSNLSFQTGEPLGVPRLLYGYVRLDGQRSAIEAGQDQMILAPRNPTSLASLAFPDLYRSGNLYLYVPQVRVERRLDGGRRGEFLVVAGALAPIGRYAYYAYDAEPGESARQPAIQTRVAWRSRTASAGEEPAWEVGLSGHYGREHFKTYPVESWATAADFNVQHGRLGSAGEFYVGRNLASLGGGLGQFGKATGGFIEGRVRATPRLEFNTGFGTDRLFDLRPYSAPLASNASLFANTIFHFTPELAGSVEYRWLSTAPRDFGPLRNNHVDLIVVYSF